MKSAFSNLAAAALISLASLAQPALAEEPGELWHHVQDAELSPATPRPSGVIEQVHLGTQSEHFAPLAVAMRTAAPEVFAPQNANGRASFRENDVGLIHGNSGMVCPARHSLRLSESGESVAEVFLFRVTSYNSSGTDVACGYVNQQQTMLVTLFASNWPETSVEDHFKTAARMMVTLETPMAEQVDIPVMAPNAAAQTNIPERTMGLAYDSPANEDGVVMREALWVNKTRGWHIKVRATHMPPATHPLVLGMFVHANALDAVAVDTGILSNQLVNAAPESDLARTISWQSE